MVDVEVGVNDRIDRGRIDAGLPQRLVQVAHRKAWPLAIAKPRIHEHRAGAATDDVDRDREREEPPAVSKVRVVGAHLRRMLREESVEAHEQPCIQQREHLNGADCHTLHTSCLRGRHCSRDGGSRSLLLADRGLVSNYERN